MATSADDIKALMKKANPLFGKGDADAQYNLGKAYYYGEGVSEDKKKACEWYRKAAEQGHAFAKTELEKLAKQGVVEAQAALKSHSVPSQSSPSAIVTKGSALPFEIQELLKKAKVPLFGKGDADAQFALGVAYDFGQGVIQRIKSKDASGTKKPQSRDMRMRNLGLGGHMPLAEGLQRIKRKGASGTEKPQSRSMRKRNLILGGRMQMMKRFQMIKRRLSSGTKKLQNKAMRKRNSLLGMRI